MAEHPVELSTDQCLERLGSHSVGRVIFCADDGPQIYPVNFAVDDGTTRTEILLDRPDVGLHVPPMVWATQFDYSPEARLLVLASDVYDEDDYIRNYDDFAALVRRG